MRYISDAGCALFISTRRPVGVPKSTIMVLGSYRRYSLRVDCIGARVNA